MLKVFCAVAIVAFSSYAGYFCAGKYRKRKAFLFQLNSFNERFLNELNFNRRPLKALLKEGEYTGEFKEFLSNYEVGKIICEHSFLSSDDKSLVNAYFSTLGKGDSFSQSGYFSNMKQSISKSAADAELALKKYGDLYLKLGFLAGLAIVVLIV